MVLPLLLLLLLILTRVLMPIASRIPAWPCPSAAGSSAGGAAHARPRWPCPWNASPSATLQA